MLSLRARCKACGLLLLCWVSQLRSFAKLGKQTKKETLCVSQSRPKWLWRGFGSAHGKKLAVLWYRGEVQPQSFRCQGQTCIWVCKHSVEVTCYVPRFLRFFGP